MLSFPNAKINIGINIVSKRPDGYHNIETLFYPIGLKDRLEINESRTTVLSISGLDIDSDMESNLVVRALRLMQAQYDVPEMKISIGKHIPMGAGLGGGSSDAAYMLLMINEMYGLGLSKEELARMAVKLGADCPFFIYNRPMLASGIGDVLTPSTIDLQGYRIVLVKPEIHVSTAEAYAGCTLARWNTPLPQTVQQPVESWHGVLVNDFEKQVFTKHPALAGIKRMLYDMGAVYASMSGSGSSIYGLFKGEVPAEETLRKELAGVTDAGCFVYVE